VTPTILAMGGGGFTMEPDNPALDDYVLELAGPREPRILFLPTASGDPAAQIAAFHQRFGDKACRAEHLSLFRLHGTTRPVEEILLDQDVIYVGGGSMRNLLAIWKAHGLDDVFREAWRRGIVLAGLSAGAMCWFEGAVTKSMGRPEPIAGLGLLPGSLTVHADGEPERLPVWLEAVRSGALPGGWAADDGVALVFRDRTLERVVSSRPERTALRADAVDGELLRKRLQPELLGAAPGVGGRGVDYVDEDVRELRRVARIRGGHGARPWR
jgi:dipeptidase E